MSPGSKYNNGFGPPFDDDQFDDESSNNRHRHHNQRHPPSPELEDHLDDSSDNSSQMIKDGNAVILREFEATTMTRQYSNSQAKGSNKASVPILTLEGVDWSGFSGAAHKTEGRPGSSKRLHAGQEEILELSRDNITVQESTLRLVQRKLSIEVNGQQKKSASSSSSRRLSPGKYQSRRASARNLLTPSSPGGAGDMAGGSMPLNDARARTTSIERRARTSSKDRQSRGVSRSRRNADRLGGVDSAHTSSQRSRRGLRNRPNGGEGDDAEAEGQQGDGAAGSGGLRKRRSVARRSNQEESGDAASPVRSPGTSNRGPRLERRPPSSKPGKERSLSSGALRVPLSARPDRKPRKHRSVGVIDATRPGHRTTGRSISPVHRPRGKSPSAGRGLAAASATTLEVGSSRPKSTRTRRGSNGGLVSGRDLAGNELIANKGSIRW